MKSDSEMFDIRKIWKLGGKSEEGDVSTFKWKNLNILQESLTNCWLKVVQM